MCGIVLMAGNLNATHEKALETLLLLDALRGKDSTGIVAVGKFKEAEVKIAKQVGDPYQLFDDKKYDAALRLPNRVIIGHNRYATMGGVSRANAHPFENDSLVGVHNGTLKNKHVLDSAPKFKVDSENLYHHIAKNGLDDALKIIDGAWALAWWDKDDETLNILRNKERPLFWCSSVNAQGLDDGQCFFAASEPWMLNIALNRHNISVGAITQVREDTHFKLPIGVGGVLGKPIVREAPGTFKPQIWEPYRAPVVPRIDNKVTQLHPVAKPSLVKEEEAKAEGKKSVSVSSTDTSYVSNFDRHYLRAKNVLFELMDGCADKNGVEYLALFDPKQPYYEIRLYPETMADTIWEMTGSDVQADISLWVPSDIPGRGYYTVRQNSVRVMATLEPDEKKTITHKGASGRDMNIVEWQRAYPSCAWCSSPLDFGSARFSTAAEPFCLECAKHPEVLDYVKF